VPLIQFIVLCAVFNVCSVRFSSFPQVQFPPGKMDAVKIGASVALNGTCLTVTSANSDQLTFDVIAETLRRTNLGALVKGSTVNFERSARMGDEIGGHIVSGHVHTMATICAIEKEADNHRMVCKLTDAAWRKYILPKGFVAVDGCSLTVGEVGCSLGSFCFTLKCSIFRSKSYLSTWACVIEK
jgi:riboflavin synthase